MDTDLVLTIGVLLIVLSLPSLLSAWVESKFPRLGAALLLVALGMILTAVTVRPGGYAFNEVPGVMLEVASRLVK